MRTGHGRRSPSTARDACCAEIGDRVGLRGIGSVHYHLRKLEEKGVVVREPWQPCSIRLTRRPEVRAASAPAPRVMAGFCTVRPRGSH
ncbi:LexA family protein [Streptomyces sp. NPDC001135]